MKKVMQIMAKLILAYITTVSIAGVSGYGITGIEIMLPCIFALTLLVYHKAYDRVVLFSSDTEKKKMKRDLACSVPVGVILAGSITVGSHYDIWNQLITTMGIADGVYFVVLSVFLSAAVLLLFGMLDNISDVKTEADNTQKKTADAGKIRAFGIKNYVITTVIFLVCWLPYYLTLLPGNMGIDTFEEIDMCMGNIAWTNHHPIFYTMLIGIVLKLTSWSGSINFSMGVFASIQMVLVAITLSRITGWIWENRKSDFSRMSIIALIFFALHPVIPMFAIYISKDVLFSCAIAMLSLTLYDILKAGNIITQKGDASDEDGNNIDENEDKTNAYSVSVHSAVRMAVWSLFTMLLRNNGLMIVIIMGLFLVFVFRKEWKKLLPAVVLPVIVFVAFKSCAYNVLNVEKQSFAESASIPLQQTGYVIAYSDGDCIEGLSEEENELLARIMPFDRVREVYELGYTDCLKFDEQFDDAYFNDHATDYMKVWLHLLPTHFSEYVKAYLAQTAGYWHYGESNTLCTQGVSDNSLGIRQVNLLGDAFAGLAGGVIEQLMLLVRKAPILCMLCSMAIQIYMVLLLACNYIRKKRGGRIVWLLPVILLWVTIMIATPAFCLFRYTFALFLLWPVWFKELLD